MQEFEVHFFPHVVFTILFTSLTLLLIDWCCQSCSTRLIVYSFSSSLKCSHEYIGHNKDFKKNWVPNCLVSTVARKILNQSQLEFLEFNLSLIFLINAFLVCVVPNYLNPATLWRIYFRYVVICPCVELTSHVHKAPVRCISY